MKKIPTLFERIYENHKIVGITDKVTPGMEWVLEGEGDATVKWDGSCCAIINGELYKRYDAKKGKTPPKGAISCCDPDPITGHWPHWVKVSYTEPGDKWFVEAYAYTLMLRDEDVLLDGTYEVIGPHFQGNPYNFEFDWLAKHGNHPIYLLNRTGNRTFDNIKLYLETHDNMEGIVFWKDGKPQCKIKRSDFGFEWPVKNKEDN